MNPKPLFRVLRLRRSAASWAPLALMAFWLMILPLVYFASSWAVAQPSPLDLARREFLAGEYGRAQTDYRRLAEANTAEAQFWLAHMLELGLGSKADPKEALAWYEKAANGGMVSAQRRLGEIYRDGVLAPQDGAKARDWLQEAATSGDAVAERELGLLWQDGIGGRKDRIEAYVWLALAARHGDQPAVKLRDRVLSGMSVADQSEAESLAASRGATASNAAGAPLG